MENNKKRKRVRVELTDLSISFMYKSARIFYSVETRNPDGSIEIEHKNIYLRGSKYLDIVLKLKTARNYALKEVKEKEGLNVIRGNSKDAE